MKVNHMTGGHKSGREGTEQGIGEKWRRGGGGWGHPRVYESEPLASQGVCVCVPRLVYVVAHTQIRRLTSTLAEIAPLLETDYKLLLYFSKNKMSDEWSIIIFLDNYDLNCI